MTEEEREGAWIAGNRAAWTNLLQTAIRELGYDGPEVDRTRWILEREAALVALSELCLEFLGSDVRLPPDLHLADVIEKYVSRPLQDKFQPF